MWHHHTTRFFHSEVLGSEGWREARRSLKTFLFAAYWCIQCIGGYDYALYKSTLYLLTYLATLPEGNQEPLVVKDKVGRPPGELGVSKSVECKIFPSVLRHCWLGDRKDIRPVKSWVLVCWWWWFDWSFARLITSVVNTHHLHRP